MDSSDNLFTNKDIDQSWALQGRIIPPSCTKGIGCVLHLQTRLSSWADQHFHVGRITINSEAGVEFVSTLLMPPDISLLQESLDSKEQEAQIEYLAMAKLVKPSDAIAFATLEGLTIVVQSDGLNQLFAASEKCKSCTDIKQNNFVVETPTDVNNYFDPLMHMVDKGKNH